MIICFSGTGNSRFVADYLADKLDDTVVSLNECLKNNRRLECTSEKPYVIVAPIYAWRLPLTVEKAIAEARLMGNKNVYCVATMGENSGDADKYIENIISAKGLVFNGFTGVVMQNNYLLMETMPDQIYVIETVKSALPKLEAVTETIKNCDRLEKDDKTLFASFMSGFVNKGFNKYMLKKQKFIADERCISCGNCEEICPMNNIKVSERGVVFGKNCMGCFACLHNCLTEAINIKGKTEEKGRYKCPSYSEWHDK